MALLRRRLIPLSLFVLMVGGLFIRGRGAAIQNPLDDLAIVSHSLVSSQRVNRFQVDFTFRADIFNAGPMDVQNVTATITSLSPNTVVMDGSLAFGEVRAGATVTSDDTYTVRDDRRFPFNDADLIFDIAGDVSPPRNSPPVAHAGFDPVAVVGQTVQLDGSFSTDVDGDLMSSQWSVVSSPTVIAQRNRAACHKLR